MRTAIVLFVFAALFIGLTVSSYRQESATFDEPQHLVTGYAALKLGDYRLDIEHPPFLRIWAALPLLTMSDVHLNTNTIFWSSVKPWHFSHQFLYVDNDADRLLYRARFMSVLLGVVLGLLLFGWSRELFGFWPATIVLGLYCWEPNILAHFSLVTTDAGATCFIFGAVYFLWRVTRRLSAPNLTGLVVFFTLAQVSKFSALVLGPIVLALLVIHALRNNTWSCALAGQGRSSTRGQRLLVAAGIVLLLAIASYAAIWAANGFRYAPAPPGAGLDRIVMGPKAHERLPTLTAVLDWVDEHRLLPNAYTQGFALGQAAAQTRTAYLLGKISFTGWWYYFPVALLVKTPISLIVLFVAGLALCAMDRSNLWRDDLFILLPIAVYLGVSMNMNINIGLRHILPIYPLGLLIAGKVVAAVLLSRRKLLAVALAVLCLLQVGEVAAVHPHELAFFNRLVGGPKNGYKYLADSNLDWGQDLKRLKKWMDTNGVDRINLSYFGSADPGYYRINCTYLLGSPVYMTDRVQKPVLPGLVAVCMNNLTGAGLEGSQFYKPLLDAEPVATIGYSIRVYRVEKPWW